MYDREYFDYQSSRGWFRKWIRGFYLRSLMGKCQGKIIDLGCGVGELINGLNNGSIGFEINKLAVDYCRQRGLNVSYYNSSADDYMLSLIKNNEYQTLVMSHVLEHLDNPKKVVNNILKAAEEKGLSKIIFVVPGRSGFLSDKTHKNFITMKFFENINDNTFKVSEVSYFPINIEKFGNYFVHNEMIVVYDRKN